MHNEINPTSAPERFAVYMPVPNAPVVESPVSQAEVDAYVAKCDAFVRQRNAWFIDAALRREIERVFLARRA